MKYIKLYEAFVSNDKLVYIREEGKYYTIYIWDEEYNKEAFEDCFENYKDVLSYIKKRNFILVTKQEFYTYYNKLKSELLLAPNGKRSNLSDELYRITRSESFKKWFGDFENNPDDSSRVVDKNGDQLIVYHGTTANFHKFDPNMKGKRGGLREKYFAFTTNKKMAEFYSTDAGRHKFGIVKPFFLNIRNMPMYDNHNRNYRELNVWAGYDYKNIFYIQDFHENGFIKGDDKHPGEIIQFDKTDGFLVKNTIEKESWPYKDPNDYLYIGDTYYVHDPEQIKIADGSNSTFNPLSDDVRE